MQAPADRPLEALEADIWTMLDRGHGRRLRTRVRLLQGALAALAFAASLLAGMRSVQPAAPELDVFSTRLALSSAALIGEDRP